MTAQAGTALIAGIGGIIGDALARTLLEAGWTVRGLSRRGSQIGQSIVADLGDVLNTVARSGANPKRPG